MRLPSRRRSVLLYLCSSIVVAQNDPASAPEDTAQPLALDPYALAVLPLRIVSDDPQAPEAAAAVYEVVLDELHAIDGLYVVGSARAAPYSVADLSPVEIAHEMGVSYVVHGEIYDRDERWALELALSDVRGVDRRRGGTVHSRFKRPESGEAEDVPDLVDVREQVARFLEHFEQSLFPERQPDQQQVIAEMRAKILDESTSDVARVVATEALPVVSGAHHSYVETRSQALSGPPAAALAQIAMRSDNARLRWRVWRELTGVRDPNLVTPLLFALDNDADGTVRIEAALRLVESFRGAPGVDEALARAAENDASEQVRNSVRLAALPEADQEQALRATVLDTSASYDERLAALRKLRITDVRTDGRFRELDHEIIVATVDMARSATTPRARYDVWLNLNNSEDPYIVEPLLEELAAAPSDDMKSLAVRALGRFLDHPGVRDALERVAAEDASMKIREVASEALAGVQR